MGSVSADDHSRGSRPRRAASPSTDRVTLKALADPDARTIWSDFVKNYKPMVVAAGRSVGLTSDECEDLAMKVLREAGAKVSRMDLRPAPGGFRKLLKTIARRRAISMLRLHKPDLKLRAHRSPEVADTGPDTIERLQDPIDRFDAWMDRELIRGAVRIAKAITKTKVSAKQWQIFECRELREWTRSRVSDALGVTENQVSIASSRVSPIFEAAVKEAKRRLNSPGPLSPEDKKALAQSSTYSIRTS